MKTSLEAPAGLRTVDAPTFRLLRRLLANPEVLVGSATAATIVFLLEILHLAAIDRLSPSDITTSLPLVLLIYLASAAIVALLSSLITGSTLLALLLTSILLYAVSVLKLLFLNSVLLKSTAILLCFCAASSIAYIVGIASIRRFKLNPAFILTLAVILPQAFRWAARDWGTRGGDLLRYALNPLTLAVVGGVLLTAGCAVWLSAKKRGLSYGSGIAILVLVAVAATSFVNMPTERPPELRSLTAVQSSQVSDIYVVSIDALRKDVFDRACLDSALKEFCDLSTRYENVIADGLATYEILSKNAGTARGVCGGSLPETLRRRGSFASMYLGVKLVRLQGHECFDFYYTGSLSDLLTQFSIPAAVEWLTSGPAESARGKTVPSTVLVEHLFASAPASSPLFAYLHLLDMHAPYIPSVRVEDEVYLKHLDKFMTHCHMSACNLDVPENRFLLTQVRNAYEETVPDIVKQVNAVMAFARSRGRPFQLIVTADHGELFGEHGGIAHSGGFVPELLSIPFAVYDSAVNSEKRRDCSPMLSSTALRHVVLRETIHPSERITVRARHFGEAHLDFARKTIEYAVSPKLDSQRGTWRNVHKQRNGSLPFEPATCVR